MDFNYFLFCSLLHYNKITGEVHLLFPLHEESFLGNVEV